MFSVQMYQAPRSQAHFMITAEATGVNMVV